MRDEQLRKKKLTSAPAKQVAKLSAGASVAFPNSVYGVMHDGSGKRTKGGKQLRLLHCSVIRHGHEAANTTGCCHHRQADAGAAHRALRNETSALQQAAGKSLVHDALSHSVFHAAARVQELRLP